jgi:hypothetical protein
MRYRLLLLPILAAAAAIAVVLPARAADFVAGTEDLPLMGGLLPVPGSSVVFDKPQGRIIEAQARGKVTREQVEGFYAATLPQLGWAATGVDSWSRDKETLHLDFSGREGSLTVGFTLSPQ